MTQEVIVTIGKEFLEMTFIMVAPLLGAAMIVGLSVGIFQAVSSIHEQTLTFLPKVFAVLGVFLFCLPWMLSKMTSYTITLIHDLTKYSQ
ncbi:MAG: flagellar biosynthesis protein FliQ [Candidatus Brocadiaceae bacterium]|nr:flagellar biosynthesis protein FliQ [Candidatus Brocadiaceae bacterium]